MNQVSRPAFRYYGSGWNRAPWIISHMPMGGAYPMYLEPCIGSASVALRKPISTLETGGDLDDRVVNALCILRDNSEALIQAIKLTPWAESEYQLSKVISPDPLEDARRFWFSCWMSVQGGPSPGKSGFRYQRDIASRYTTPPSDAININHLYEAAARLKQFQILKRDALEMIGLYKGKDCLIYFDPPYPEATRDNRTGYNHEFTDKQHEAAAELLRDAVGPVLVSGYANYKNGSPNTLYQEIYETHGWQRIDREYQTNSGGKRIESIWLNPLCQEMLTRERNIQSHFMMPISGGIGANDLPLLAAAANGANS